MSVLRKILCGSLLLAVAIPFAQASTPSSGTLTTTSGPQTYTAGPYFVANATPVPMVDTGPRCNGTTFMCDSYALTVTLPTGYAVANPNDTVKISLSWTDTAAGADYDLYVFNGATTTQDGTETPAYSSATSSDPEVVYIPVADGTNTFTINIVPYTPSGETLNVSASLMAGPAATAGGGATAPATGTPRFQVYNPPTADGNDTQGEFSIGWDSKTGNIMTLADLTTYKLTPPELVSDPVTPSAMLPESCDATWTDVSFATESVDTLDPILWTDSPSGRTLQSQQTTGAQALFAYTDDDGTNWTPISAAPPNGGVDHETIGTGPYPAGSQFGTVAAAAGFNYATYYCSQADLPAYCQRSDTGGTQFGPGIPIYNGVTTNCGGIHGHVRVAPNGAVYVPNKGCGTTQGGAVSMDAGTTWSEFLPPASTPGKWDPSVATDADSTAYFCYDGADGHAHVSVSKDNGTTWINDFDIGASMGIKNAVFPEAKGGDSGRAACGFLGTTSAGNSDSLDFTGVWYLFIATTYDGGVTWTTVNATPNDPVQGAGGVCSSGIGCNSNPNNRNLLDFNEITLGSNGRILFGYDKGCVGGCILDPSSNSFVADMRVVRQSGGKTLLAKYDTAEPAKPNAACLAGTRDMSASYLTWKAPDSGGADVANYKIYRSTSPTAFSSTPIATTADAKITYNDTTSGTVTPIWYYKITALNSQGEGIYSNIVKLPISAATTTPESPCIVPGVTVATDVSGDETDMLPQHDVLSVQMAEPYNAATPPGNNLVIALNLSSASTIPPNTIYYVRFNLPDGVQYFVSYDTSAVPAAFNYGHVTTTAGTGTGMDNTDGTLDASSGVDTTNNRITFVLPKNDIAALANNAKLTAIVGESRLLVGAMGTGLIEQIDATSSGSGVYQQVGNAFCAPNTVPMAALSAMPLTGNSPLNVAFDASGSSDPDMGDSVVSYTFDFNDGSAAVTQATPTVSHTYTLASGSSQTNYKPTVTVTDTHGAASTNAAFVIIQVTAANTAPTASLTATPTSGAAPLTVNFDGSGSSDPDAGDSVAMYTFNFGDGSASVTQTTPTVSHSYGAAGSYTATLTVSDTHGASSTNSAQQVITVTAATAPNNPPTAKLSATPTSGTAPLVVDFDGSGSSDPDAGDSVSSYSFDFGDGSAVVTQAGATASHSYSAAGTYTAKLTVTDTHGASSTNTAQQVITVTTATTPNTAPTAKLTSTPTSGTAPLMVTFDGSGSSDPDSGDHVAMYSFNFGDGSATVTQTSPTVTHTYNTAGSYTAQLIVTDTHNAQSTNSATVTTTVTAPAAADAAPTASLKATPTSGAAPLTVMFDGSASSDPDSGDSVAMYTFSFGDGSSSVTQSTPTVSHTYTTSGSFTATLTVKDTHGMQSANTAAQVITTSTTPPANPAPTASFTASPDQGAAPLTVTFNASASSASGSGNSIAVYYFDFGDGSPIVSSTSPTVTHTYTADGNYTATLTVTDSQGSSSTNTSSVAISVSNQTRKRGTGGAFGLPMLAGLAGLAALRRRGRNRARQDRIH